MKPNLKDMARAHAEPNLEAAVRQNPDFFPEPDEPPVIIRKNRYTMANAVVNMNYGICMTPGAMLAKRCKEYKKEIIFRKEDSEFCCDATSILELLSLGAAKGAKLTILVEGTDAESADIAMQMYSALTSENSYNLDFSRF
jgi:phosphotransferase system HPr (HPr) family protein